MIHILLISNIFDHSKQNTDAQQGKELRISIPDISTNWFCWPFSKE